MTSTPPQTPFRKVLVANRGEVALRIVRALREMEIESVAIYARDDAHAPHVRAASEALALDAIGPAAYLDGARLVAIARARGCDAVHPGYGFLSERADFARACAAAGLRFIGPTPEQLALFGDKARSRALAQRCGVPVMPGSQQAVTLDQAQAFFAAQCGAGTKADASANASAEASTDACATQTPGVMLKAIGGGGGRGMRAVTRAQDLPAAYARCRSEARSAFGVEGVYVERLMTNARHIEIQIVGDGRAVCALGERECTLQRRFQKLVEIAPSPSLDDALRQRLVADALALARAVRYEGLGTFEFLVDQASPDLPYVFIEANPRLQVEHTVTEEVTGVDLVHAQIALAAGRRLADLGLDAYTSSAPPAPRGFAIQWRINAETLDAHGNAWPGSMMSGANAARAAKEPGTAGGANEAGSANSASEPEAAGGATAADRANRANGASEVNGPHEANEANGTLTRFDLPAGPGIRIDTHGVAGGAPSPYYDTLLAKLIVHARGASFDAALRRSRRALAEFQITGVATNLPLLRALAADPAMQSQRVHTRWFEAALPRLIEAARAYEERADADRASGNREEDARRDCGNARDNARDPASSAKGMPVAGDASIIETALAAGNALAVDSAPGAAKAAVGDKAESVPTSGNTPDVENAPVTGNAQVAGNASGAEKVCVAEAENAPAVENVPVRGNTPSVENASSAAEVCASEVANARTTGNAQATENTPAANARVVGNASCAAEVVAVGAGNTPAFGNAPGAENALAIGKNIGKNIGNIGNVSSVAKASAGETENTPSVGNASSAVKTFASEAANTQATENASHTLLAPMPARVVQWSVAEGDVVAAGAELGVLEAMKMEHVLSAPYAGRVRAILAQPGDYLAQGQALLALDPVDAAQASAVVEVAAHDPDHLRADLRAVLARHAQTLDAARESALARRHARGARSARENIADLCDAGSFIEYGALAVAAQRSRRTLEDLCANTPADGIVTGVGSVNGALFGADGAGDTNAAARTRTTVLAYDATVLAGTQGYYSHAKTDRMLELSLRQKLPVVLFAEGGGGRPGDVDSPVVAGLDVGTFASYAALSGQVPVVGIAAGRCFAGNAALLGCSDVIIATRDSNIGMGGPAMIEGGGLGVFTPEQIGPSQVQHANGVIDVLVDDEREAVAVARHYLAFFQGATAMRDARAPDARALRHVVPENRLRVYDTRAAFAHLVDEGSLLMLRAGFGNGIHTALARIEGHPLGLLANNPLHLGGAIDADAADKAARFMQLCNVHGLPLVSLVDTPGFMVGPDVEATAQVRHVSRLFVAAAHLRVPCFAVVLRKGYGLGAMAMTAGGFHAPVFTISWPTGEFGGMGLEGAVRLGYRKELDALPAGPERDALFERLLARQYERGAAMNMAMALEIDAVIDPADTRAWLARGLASAKTGERVVPFVDAW